MKRIIFLLMFVLLIGMVSAAPDTIQSFQDFESTYDLWSVDRTTTAQAYSGTHSYLWGSQTHTLHLSPMNESDTINFTFKYYLTSTAQNRIQWTSDSDYSIANELLTMIRTYGGNWEYLTPGPFVAFAPHCLNEWCEISIVWDRPTGTTYFYHNGVLMDSYVGGGNGDPVSVFMDPLREIGSGSASGNLYIDDFTIAYDSGNTAPTIDDHTTLVDDIKSSEIVTFELTTTDAENDDLTYEWRVDNVVMGTSATFDFDAAMYEAGIHTIYVEISDGEYTDSATWDVDVRSKGGDSSLSVTGNIVQEDVTYIVTDLSQEKVPLNPFQKFLNWLRGIFR